ncbi:hypothetical protein NE237_002773 [Protea cynaroides]|uniref:Uncharacterized protein n=1 Tax=Protea cynaroides TaxID=273540 RepID=A0A9Q0QS43_9MAGN|nr:hypothetical protein NE237_002773 [Protea cynaroides]
MLASTPDEDFLRLIAFDVQVSNEYSKYYIINGCPPFIAGRDGKSGIQSSQVPEWITPTTKYVRSASRAPKVAVKRGGTVIISGTRNVQEDEIEGFSALQTGILSVDETVGVLVEDETGGIASDSSIHIDSSDGEWVDENQDEESSEEDDEEEHMVDEDSSQEEESADEIHDSCMAPDNVDGDTIKLSLGMVLKDVYHFRSVY